MSSAPRGWIRRAWIPRARIPRARIRGARIRRAGLRGQARGRELWDAGHSLARTVTRVRFEACPAKRVTQSRVTQSRVTQSRVAQYERSRSEWS